MSVVRPGILRRPLLLAALLAVAAAGAAPAPALADPVAGDTVVGELVRAWSEPAGPEAAHGEETAHGDEPISWIETGNGDAVRVATDDVAGIETGAIVEADIGAAVPDAGAEHPQLAPAREVLAAEVVAAAPPDPPVSRAGSGITNAVTVVQVVPAGTAPDGRALADVVAAVDGPVADYWARQTGGAVRIGVTASAGWLRAAAGCDAPHALWAEAAAQTGWVRGPNRHLLLSLPSGAAGCGAGLAEVGSSPTSGGRLYVSEVATSVIAHELGHNFGLGHAAALHCDGAVEAGACRVDGYGDWYDVMGVSWQHLGSLSALHADRLGVLAPAAVRAVAAGAPPVEVDLAPIGSGTGIRAVRLADVDGDVYWVEHRAAVGQDGWLAAGGNWRGLQQGVVVRLAREGDSTSWLLDATPSRPAQWDADAAAVVPAGGTTVVGDAGFTVRVVAAGAAGARIAVSSGTAAPATPVGGQATGEIGGRGSSYFLNDRFTGVASSVFVYGDPGDSVFLGDWDGDGVDTLLVRRGNTFHVRNRNSSGVADASFVYGDAGDPVLVGDWDGDGRDSLAVRRGNRYFVQNSVRTGVADLVVVYGDAGDTVLVGDWDGDRADSLAVRRGDRYLVKNSLTTGVADATVVYGAPDDVVLVGRWRAGQRGDSLAVRRGNAYHLRFSLTSGWAEQVTAYGEPTDTAFAGDWNGDGVDTLGVRRTP